MANNNNDENNNDNSWVFQTEKYSIQKELWPPSGKHILAQYTDQAILVYQAYNNQIADDAIQNQKFGGPHWSSTRMTWIKTNFLWMMFRSNWGQKKNQERILGVWLKRKSFEKYLSMGSSKDHPHKGTVRLQWDPDHYPDGEKHPFRRAVQLGLKNVTSFISGEDIVRIDDLTDLAKSQYPAIKNKDFDSLVIPLEKIYPVQTVGNLPEGNQDEPLRVTLCYKGKQKVVVLQERSDDELEDLVNRKFKIKPKMVTLSSGEMVTDQILQNLPQGSVLNVS